MPPPFSYAPARQDGKRMEKIEKARWIWLDRSRYTHAQRGIYTVFNEGGLFAGGTEYAVATFIGEIFCERAETLRVRSSADCKYILRVNGKIAMRGPLPVGGDYANESALGYRFCDEYDLALAAGKNEIRADVFLYPDVMTDYSDGHGGFYFEGWFSDGRTVCADESWLGYLNESYVSRGVYDAAEKIVPCRAKFTENIWHLLCAGLPALRYERIFPVSERGGVFDFGRIYSCYLHARIVSRSEGGSLVFECFEKEGYFCTRREKVLLKRGTFEYDGTALCSARYVRILAPEGTSVSPALDFCRYPAEETGFFECSDGQLNEIYEACRHASAICRQGCHLDSPFHQEALGCTGDYYIESLMEHYLLSDRRLIRLDILRTARLLEIKGGKMFHTTYSLIFFEWVNDYLLFSGDRRILRETERARKLVLARFLAHIDADGLCSMPDYLFVDWVKTGEFTLHHPPKAMGQAVLNAFLYRALTLFGGYETEAERLKAAFRQKLWDEERGLFFGGLAEREEEEESPWRPRAEGRYFNVHENALAVLYGLCPEERCAEVMERALSDDSLPAPQPYFMHFVFGALDRAGLFGKYGRALLAKWGELLKECKTSLKEVWSGFDCDYSHAWGGTPLIQMFGKILGVTPTKEGFTEYEFYPRAIGLDFARGRICTPRGKIEVFLEKGKQPVLKEFICKGEQNDA